MFQDARSSTSLKACAVYTRVKQEGGKRKVNSNRSYQKWKEYPFFFCKSLVHFVHVRASQQNKIFAVSDATLYSDRNGPCMIHRILELRCIISLVHTSQMPSKFQYTFAGNMCLLWYDKVHRREKDIERFCERENGTEMEK